MCIVQLAPVGGALPIGWPLGPALLFSLHGWVTAVYLYSVTCVRMPLSVHFALSGIRVFPQVWIVRNPPHY